jgi:acyl carrier protein
LPSALPGGAREAAPTLSVAAGRKSEQPEGAEFSTADVAALRCQLAAAGLDERMDLLVDYVRVQVMDVLRLDRDQRPDRRHRLMDLGLDSLMAVQLRNVLEAGLGLPGVVPATLMFDYPTIEAIAAFLSQHLFAVSNPPPSGEVGAGAAEQARLRSSQLAALSEEEAAELLMKRLEQ